VKETRYVQCNSDHRKTRRPKLKFYVVHVVNKTSWKPCDSPSNKSEENDKKFRDITEREPHPKCYFIIAVISATASFSLFLLQPILPKSMFSMYTIFCRSRFFYLAIPRCFSSEAARDLATDVLSPLGLAGSSGAGVVVLVAGALRLCAMWDLTK